MRGGGLDEWGKGGLSEWGEGGLSEGEKRKGGS